MCVGLISSRVSELWMPPRRPEVSVRGTSTVRSLAWYMYTVPAGIRWDTIARATTTPLRLSASIHSLSLTPIVVGVLRAHPDLRPAARQRQHEQVVLVLGVDRPLRVRGQVAHRHLLAHAGGLVAEEAVHVQRRAEDRQVLAELAHPVVVEEEVHPPGQRVPRLEPLDVDGEGGVAPAAVLAAGPLRAR